MAGTGYVSPEQARRFYDRIGRGQDTRPLSERRALDALAAQGDFGRARAVVEFGCGTGRFAARLLRERLPDDATYLGLDVSPHMVALATESVGPSGGPRPGAAHRGRRASAGGRRVRRPARQHVRPDLLSPADASVFVAEAHRVLRPGGALAVASLAPGRTPPARAVTRLWRGVWSLNPALLGGCRPITLGRLLDPEHWSVLAHFPVTDWLLSSEILVARLRQEAQGCGTYV